ncbi:hypothetical protein BMETH_93010161083865, partial [methanotrophic bacterial endosymbiont of Bathymodiolus sp.]
WTVIYFQVPYVEQAKNNAHCC